MGATGPDDDRRARLLAALFCNGFANGARDRATWGAFDPATGAMIGAAYAYIDAGDGLPEMASHVSIMRAHLSESEIDRVGRSFDAMVGLGADAAPLPVRHLELLGVDDAQRGRGAGSRLLRHIMEVAQEEGMPLRLDTHDPATSPCTNAMVWPWPPRQPIRKPARPFG